MAFYLEHFIWHSNLSISNGILSHQQLWLNVMNVLGISLFFVSLFGGVSNAAKTSPLPETPWLVALLR